MFFVQLNAKIKIHFTGKYLLIFSPPFPYCFPLLFSSFIALEALSIRLVVPHLFVVVMPRYKSVLVLYVDSFYRICWPGRQRSEVCVI